MIITQKVNPTPVVSGANETATYHIKSENVGHLMGIMRDMYSDPIMAVVREYAANAVDAHTLVEGMEDRPIEITLPTALDLTYSVRDFGPGLSPEDFIDQICGIGSSGSHKRESNKMIGGLGIGAKCAHAVCDQFTYTIWHQGTKYVWSCYKDELDMSKAVCLSKTEDNSTSGCLVQVPVKAGDVVLWSNKVTEAFTYYRVQPIVHNLTCGIPCGIDNKQFKLPKFEGTLLPLDIVVEGEKVEVYLDETRNGLEDTRIVMGGLVYPIDSSSVTESRGLALKGIVIKAPIGFVQLAPSRESLRYSTFTKNKLHEVLSKISVYSLTKPAFLDRLFSGIDKDLDKVDTWASIREIVTKTVGYTHVTVKDLDTYLCGKYPHIDYNGVKYNTVSGEGILENLKVVFCRRFYMWLRKGQSRDALNVGNLFTQLTDKSDAVPQQSVSIGTDSLHRIYIGYTKNSVVNMSDSLRSFYHTVFNYLSFHKNRSTIVFIAHIKDVKDLDTWMAKIPWLDKADPRVQIVDMDSLCPYPKDMDTAFLESDIRSLQSARTRATRGRVSTGTKNYAQHSCRILKWKTDLTDIPKVNSEAWEAVSWDELDPEEVKYCVEIDKFLPMFDEQAVSLEVFKNIVAELSPDSPVYGIRIGDIDKILRKDHGFQMFERKLELEFVEDVRKGKINEDLLNWYLSSREYRTSLGDHVLFKVDKDTENLLVSVKEHVRSMLKVRDWLEYKHEHMRKGSKPPVIVRMISGSFFSGIQNYHIICKTITSVYPKLDVFFTSVKNTDLYSQSTEQLNIDRSNMWEASNLSLTRDLKALPDYSLLKEFHKTMLSKQPILTHLLVTKHHVDRVFNTKLCVPEFLKEVVAAEIETAKKG